MSTSHAAATSAPQKRWVYVIPVAAIMYMMAYLDRNNVAVILPYINEQGMNLSAQSQGMVSGIFFFGYMILQIPGALAAQRWSAKKTVLILMICWGFAAMACGFVQNSTQFYIARFILGVFEGGVWPACLVLLANWFPLKERARANALWMCALPLSSVLMSPLSGWLLQHFGWRDVLILEGIPPLVWGIVWWFAISDNPAKAKWVSAEERAFVEKALAADDAATPQVVEHKSAAAGYLAALKDGRVWLMILIYFCWMSGFYGFSLWLPTVLKDLTGGDSLLVGWLTAIPYGFALVFMVLVSRWSDKTQNRKLAVAIPLFVAIVFMVLGQFINMPGIQIVMLVIVAIGVYSPYGPFWAIPPSFLRLSTLAFAMGLINALGNLGGFCGPYLVGWLKTATGSNQAPFFVLAGILLLGAILTLVAVKSREELENRSLAAREAVKGQG